MDLICFLKTFARLERKELEVEKRPWND